MYVGKINPGKFREKNAGRSTYSILFLGPKIFGCTPSEFGPNWNSNSKIGILM
jgi:hypothetical protein